MRVFCSSLWFPAKTTGFDRLALYCLALALPFTASGMVSANLTWTASSDPSVVGYNIYYGAASGQYTNMVSVNDVTNTVVSDLAEGATYFFAAKARNAAGNESPFSNEAIFCGFTVAPETCAQQAAIPTNATGDQLTFSLAGAVPHGATINPTNGIFSWRPNYGYASTTNEITVTITDNTNPSRSSSETMLVVVGDYLQVGLGSTAVQAGRPGALPITLAASDQMSSLQVAVPWPAQLGVPTLTFASPVTAGSIQMQGSVAVVGLQISPAQSLAISNSIAQLNFQTAAGQPSAFLNVQLTGVTGIKNDGSSYNNVAAGAGQIVLVGAQPLLQPQNSAAQGRLLNLFGIPGANYQVQFATNLSPPIVWAPLTNYQQNALSQSLEVDSRQPTVYYRLQSSDSRLQISDSRLDP